jgi:hypothetical protein
MSSVDMVKILTADPRHANLPAAERIGTRAFGFSGRSPGIWVDGIATGKIPKAIAGDERSLGRVRFGDRILGVGVVAVRDE